ncbi:DUF859 family phage minor structural protein [Parvimonas micra]
MALSGSYQETFNNGYTVRTEWEASQNINGNYSDLTITLYLDCRSNYDLYIASRTHTVYVDGSGYDITSSRISTGGGTTITLGSFDKRIYHNSDGTCNVDLSTTLDIRARIHGSYVGSIDGGSDTIALDKIPRMSTISNIMDGSRELGKEHIIHIQKQLTGNITHDVWYVVKWEGGESGWHYIARNTKDLDLKFTSTTEYVKNQKNSGTMYIDIGCNTYKDGVQVGETTYNPDWHMHVPYSVKPIIKNIQVTEADDKTKGLGAFVENHSKFNVVTTAEGNKGSTVKDVKVTVAGQTLWGANATSKEIAGNGNITVTVVVTDSRDRISTDTRTVKVEPYALPSILKFSGHRLEQDEKTVTMTRNFKMSSIAEKNNCKWKIERRLVDGSNWTTILEGTDKVLNLNALAYDVNTNFEYEFRLTITDYYTSATQSFFVGSSFRLVEFHSSGTGLAVGQIAKRAGFFDINLKTAFHKGIEVEDWNKMHLFNETKPYDFSNELKYFKDPFGIVHLQGIAKGTTSEWFVRITREDCRPEKDLLVFVPCTGNKSATLRIRKDGNILIENRSEISTNWISIDGISFKAKE